MNNDTKFLLYMALDEYLPERINNDYFDILKSMNNFVHTDVFASLFKKYYDNESFLEHIKKIYKDSVNCIDPTNFPTIINKLKIGDGFILTSGYTKYAIGIIIYKLDEDYYELTIVNGGSEQQYNDVIVENEKMTAKVFVSMKISNNDINKVISLICLTKIRKESETGSNSSFFYGLVIERIHAMYDKSGKNFNKLDNIWYEVQKSGKNTFHGVFYPIYYFVYKNNKVTKDSDQFKLLEYDMASYALNKLVKIAPDDKSVHEDIVLLREFMYYKANLLNIFYRSRGSNLIFSTKNMDDYIEDRNGKNRKSKLITNNILQDIKNQIDNCTMEPIEPNNILYVYDFTKIQNLMKSKISLITLKSIVNELDSINKSNYENKLTIDFLINDLTKFLLSEMDNIEKFMNNPEIVDSYDFIMYENGLIEFMINMNEIQKYCDIIKAKNVLFSALARYDIYPFYKISMLTKILKIFGRIDENQNKIFEESKDYYYDMIFNFVQRINDLPQIGEQKKIITSFLKIVSMHIKYSEEERDYIVNKIVEEKLIMVNKNKLYDHKHIDRLMDMLVTFIVIPMTKKKNKYRNNIIS